MHSQKMESVGRLAGGIAHDFNNLLSPIMGFAELVLMDLPANDPSRENVEQIQQAAESAKKLISQLLVFSKKQILNIQNVNLYNVLMEFKKILTKTLRENIKLDFKIDDKNAFIDGDVSQIEQVLMNLVINSQDSILSDGEIEIGLEKKSLDSLQCQNFEDLTAGDYIILSIKDTGTGIEEKTMDHIFEPFFSTKKEGKGTGFGLSMVYGIMKQHKGSICVKSELSSGTIFRLFFPYVVSKQIKNKVIEQTNMPNSGSESILVIEDNAMVRNLFKSILTRFGYRIKLASNPMEYFEKLETEEFDLIITDIVMPEMTGKELYEKMLKKNPNIKVIFMSGYTNTILEKQGLLDKNTNFIHKPVSIKNLTSIIRKILDT